MVNPRKPCDSYLERSQGFIQDSFPNLMRCNSSAQAGQRVCLHAQTVYVCLYSFVCMRAIIIPVSRSDTGPTPHIPLTVGQQRKLKWGS